MGELKAHRITREISELHQELKLHQDKCKHVRATKKHDANTGNYCPQDDCYWTNFTCPTCLKKWTVEGSV